MFISRARKKIELSQGAFGRQKKYFLLVFTVNHRAYMTGITGAKKGLLKNKLMGFIKSSFI